MKNTSVSKIVDITQAHDGSLGLLNSYVDTIATTGVDAADFQVRIADAESCPCEKSRVTFSYVIARARPNQDGSG